jgi:hypothetical protein
LKTIMAAAMVALLAPVAVSAATFTGNFSVTGEALSDPGLAIATSPNVPGFSFNLNDGESTSLNLFHIWTDETALNADDLAPKTVAVNFNIDSHIGSVTGKSVGSAAGFLNLFFGGNVAWDAPLLLNVGTGTLAVALSNASFNYGFLDIKEGSKYGADVSANFTYTAAPAPVPLPGTLGLIAAGMSALGFFGIRRGAATA